MLALGVFKENSNVLWFSLLLALISTVLSMTHLTKWFPDALTLPVVLLCHWRLKNTDHNALEQESANFL